MAARSFCLVGGIVFEILIDAARGYDAASDTTKAPTTKHSPIVQIVLIVEVLVAGAAKVGDGGGDDIMHNRISIARLIYWVEA